MSRRKSDIESQQPDNNVHSISITELRDLPELSKKLKKRRPSRNQSQISIRDKPSLYQSVLDEEAIEVRATKRAWWRMNNLSTVRDTYDNIKDSERRGTASKTSIIRETRQTIRQSWKRFLRNGRSNLGIFVLALLEILNDFFFAVLYLVEAEYSRFNFYDPQLEGKSLPRWVYVSRSESIFYLATIFSYMV
jgi:hypothetical protein